MRSAIFNIHLAMTKYCLQNPKMLIRIIGGIATLTPEKLGWDTTLTACPIPRSPSTPLLALPSLSFQLSYEVNPPSHYWQIDMPKPQDDDPYKMSEACETFILWGTLSLSRGEVILGRATRIWKAWSQNDMKLPQERRKVRFLID